MATKAENEQMVQERMKRQQEQADRMKAKQTVVPAAPPMSTVQQEDAAKCRKLLEDNGWTLAGLDHKGDPVFADPLGAGDRRGTFIEARELPNREGEPQIVKQLVVPVSAWSYKLGEAFAIQQARDAKKQRVA